MLLFQKSDFNINFTDNRSPVNDFHYIYQDTYGSIAFTYHLKNLEPLMQ